MSASVCCVLIPSPPTLHHTITIMNSECKVPLLWLHTCAWTAWRLDQQSRAFSCSEVHLKKKKICFLVLHSPRATTQCNPPNTGVNITESAAESCSSAWCCWKRRIHCCHQECWRELQSSTVPLALCRTELPGNLVHRREAAASCTAQSTALQRSSDRHCVRWLQHLPSTRDAGAEGAPRLELEVLQHLDKGKWG